MVKRDFISTAILALIGLVVIAFLHFFVFAIYQVQENERNQFVEQGDYLVLLQNREPVYGDFVVYEIDGKDYLGRVIGKASDHLASVEDILYRNQEVVEQPFIETIKQAYLTATNHEMPFTEDFDLDTIVGQTGSTIPKSHYFILNDNRQNLEDSRQFGPISQSDVKGVVTFRLAPFDKFGFVTTE